MPCTLSSVIASSSSIHWKTLAKLKVDPNAQHPDSGYTALHVAVFKYKLDSVVALLSEFKETLILGMISLIDPIFFIDPPSISLIVFMLKEFLAIVINTFLLFQYFQMWLIGRVKQLFTLPVDWIVVISSL